jgi:hypothetical protein
MLLKEFNFLKNYLLFIYYFCIQSLRLHRQVLYHVSHSSSSLCFSYFWDRVSFYAPAGLDPETPVCASQHSWDDMRAICPTTEKHEVSWTFAWIGPKPQSSWRARTIGLGQIAWSWSFLYTDFQFKNRYFLNCSVQ